MPLHRDAGCWWASQWGSNVELMLFYRGHWLYFPGSLRVRDVWGPGPKARYERHQAYPRRGCGTASLEQRAQPLNGSATGAFHLITSDLVERVAKRAWRNRTAIELCFKPLVSSCLRRWQGALDGPALPKSGPYFFRPPWTEPDATGRSSIAWLDTQPPCV